MLTRYSKFVDIFKIYPTIFSNSDSIDYKKSIKESINKFNYLFDHYLENILFETSSVVKRRKKINNYTSLEKIYLSSNDNEFKLSDDEIYDILDNYSYFASYDNTIIRIFFINKSFGFDCICDNITSVDDQSKNIISVFIGSEFNENDDIKVSLIYDIVELICIKDLYSLNVPINKIFKSLNYIVLNDILDLNDVMFLVYYYSYIFSAIYRIFDKSIINYDYLLNKAERPCNYLFNYDKNYDFMKRIWESSKDIDCTRKIEDTIIYICNNL